MSCSRYIIGNVKVINVVIKFVVLCIVVGICQCKCETTLELLWQRAGYEIDLAEVL